MGFRMCPKMGHKIGQNDPFLDHLLIQFKGRLGPKWVPECVQKWVKNDPKMGQK